MPCFFFSPKLKKTKPKTKTKQWTQQLKCVFRKCYTLPQLNTVGGAQPVLWISPPDDGVSVAVVVVGARRRSTTAGYEERRGEERDRETNRERKPRRWEANVSFSLICSVKSPVGDYKWRGIFLNHGFISNQSQPLIGHSSFRLVFLKKKNKSSFFTIFF